MAMFKPNASSKKIAPKYNSSKSSGIFSNKKIIIGLGILVVMFILSLFLMFGGKKPNNKVSDSFAKTQEQNTTVAYTPPPPPSLEVDKNKLLAKAKENSIQNSQNKKPKFDENISENMSEAEKEKTNAMIQDLSINNGLNADGSKKEIKPEDMIAYLKAKQDTFIFNPKDDYFSFDGVDYKSGQFFKGWWIIEEINENFIRFVDDKNGYAYNLRFI
ncbi:hypothetical protein AJY73_10440 [Campylobacter jejuni]|uniref:hypothetical protein n=1 Tax=Campylobacter jejuni TaxID=197 RepID=UPI000874A42E|nr:hypothetical protein [Campylobacter jejuni]OEV61765.1 hypothetical protein AJY73_10440 [Campylobacter jejuni]